LDNCRLDDYYENMDTSLEERRAKSRRFDSPEQEAYLNLWRTYDRLRVVEDELFGRHDLTAQQYNALRLLRAGHPGKTPTLALAARLVSRAPDITRLIDRLEERGLVDRIRPPGNRRVVEVGLTPTGITLLAELDAEVRACNSRMLGHLAPAELRSLVSLLRKARGPHETADGGWL
jgi:DNA-binding MarR family transcriptional regulator